jgi:hypothetical protein
MSRGLSAQQHAILAALGDEGRTIWDLVRATGPFRNYSRYESVSRALRSLIRRGAVICIDGWPKRYATPEVAARHEHREILWLAWTTVAGRRFIMTQMGRIPTLKEWLSVGNCGICIKCSAAEISPAPAKAAP